jgi:hypothetical protein
MQIPSVVPTMDFLYQFSDVEEITVPGGFYILCEGSVVSVRVGVFY